MTGIALDLSMCECDAETEPYNHSGCGEEGVIVVSMLAADGVFATPGGGKANADARREAEVCVVCGGCETQHEHSP